MPEDYLYSAFISYSHHDRKAGEWLHRQLEKYRIPANLIGKETSAGIVPVSLGRIFRDRDELPATDDLTAEVQKALASSKYMIVLCSPASAASRWVNREVIEFKKLRGERFVLPIILTGEPFASRRHKPEEECFPPAIRYRLAANGTLSAKEAEPVAADIRKKADGKHRAILKLVAGIIGVGLDELVEREMRRRQRRVMFVTAGSITAMLAMSILTYEAVTARFDAERHRDEAEGLIEFMLTDLRHKLEPVGRLDVLDSVGDKILGYYKNQEKFEEASEDAVGRQARAYHLLGEMQFLRDNPTAALTLFEQSAAATEELLDRDPDNTQRIFEHAQSVFWVGNQALQRGDHSAAEAAWREYKRLSDRLVALEPEKVDWWIEVAYANNNMGQLYLQQYLQPEVARGYFEKGLETFQKAYEKRPDSTLLRIEISVSHTWLIDTYRQSGHAEEVRNQITLDRSVIDQIIVNSPKDQTTKTRLMVWYVKHAWAYQDAGNLTASMESYQASVGLANELLLLEPESAGATRGKAFPLYHLAALAIETKQSSLAQSYLTAATDLTGPIFADNQRLEPWWQELKIFSLLVKLQLHAQTDGLLAVGGHLETVAASLQKEQAELSKTQHGRWILAQFYKLKIQYLLATNNAAAAREMQAVIWPLIDGKNMNQIPILLACARDIAGLVGDQISATRIQTVLVERGYSAPIANPQKPF